MTNVLPFPTRKRISPQGEPVIDVLRGTARLPREDRPAMASNLGRMARALNQANPLAGAKKMFDHAWPGQTAKWDKRKRLLRLPGEKSSDPSDPAAYDAAGSGYLALAQAAARLGSNIDDAELLKGIERRYVKELVRGTTLNPIAPLQDEAEAHTLLIEIFYHIKQRIASETRITELWNIIRTNPIALAGIEDTDPYPTDDLENASLGAAVINKKLRFVAARLNEQAYSFKPIIKIGTITKSTRTQAFLFPRNLPSSINYRSLQRGPDNNVGTEAFLEWALRNEFAIVDNILIFPDYLFNGEFGWTKATLHVSSYLYFCCDQNTDGNCILRWETEGFNAIFDADNLKGINVNDHNLEGLFINDGDATFGLPNDSAALVFYPTYQSKDKKDSGKLVGYVDDIYESHNVMGDAWYNLELEAAPFVMDPNYYLVDPQIHNAAFPTPAPVGSLGAFLFQDHILSKSGESVADRIVNKAKTIAEAGIRFHEAQISFYHDKIRKG